MSFKSAVVVTTIGKGEFIERYVQQMTAEGVIESCTLIVIPDRKTPTELYQACENARVSGANMRCPSLHEQEDFLNKLGSISSIIPYNSDNRRNIGYLMALDDGCDFIISIDDDNYCITHSPFFREHMVVAESEIEMESVNSDNGWYNFCELLTTGPPSIYPRGFPYHSRHRETATDFRTEKGTVHMNEGLWLQDPDVDAITWLSSPPRVDAFDERSVLLGKDTWTPINTQNTAIAREAMTAFYFLRMGYPIAGMDIDRYGDIFSGFFCQACVRHLGHRIRIGAPIVDHIRNSHNHIEDLRQEFACILLLEDVSEWLRELSLDGTDYPESYLSLADQLEHAVEGFGGSIWNQAARGYFHQVAYYMRVWVEAVTTIGP